jgi:hypothetical protein
MLGALAGANPALGLLHTSRSAPGVSNGAAGGLSSDRPAVAQGSLPSTRVSVTAPAVTIPSTTVTVVRPRKTTTTTTPTTTTAPPPPPTTTTTAPPPPPTTTTAPPVNPPIVVPIPHHPRHPRHHHHHHRTVHHHKRHYAPPPPPPKPPPHHNSASGLPNPVKVTQGVATPSSLRFKLSGALAAVLAGALLVLLLAFPAELFNKTYEENEGEIHVLFTKLGLRRHHLSRGLGLIAFVLVGAGLTIWLALGEGSDGNPVAVGVGLLIALPLVTLAFEFPNELYSRVRSRVPGEFRVLPTALGVGLVCALISRAIDLHPAYLYGIFAGFSAARAGALTEEHEGKAVLFGALVLAVLAGLCWFGWGALDAQAHGPHRDWFVILVSTALFWIFILGAEGLVFGLVPLDYLEGKALRRWRGRIWLVTQLAALAFFVYVQMLHGETEKISEFSELIKPIAFFAGFGLVSFVFWGYFHWDKRPTARFAAEGESEHVAEEGTPGIAT